MLDPCCGTGTTALVCAERGIACDTTDINPFLIWLAKAKAHAYSNADRDAFTTASVQVAVAIRSSNGRPAWRPPLHEIEKWWDAQTLAALSHAMASIKRLEPSLSSRACDLLKVAFCRTMMDHAHVSFGHQSMSFKQKRKHADANAALLPGFAEHPVAATWEQAVPAIATAAGSPIERPPRALLLDARDFTAGLEADHYTCVLTSPPYCNRMSYIRELRPYMFRYAGENLHSCLPDPARAVFRRTNLSERGSVNRRLVRSVLTWYAESVGSASTGWRAIPTVGEMAKNKGSGQIEFTPQNFTVRFDLYPLVAMIRENALQLAQTLSAHHEWTDIHMSDEEWVFSRRQPRQGQPGGAIKVRVKDDEVHIEHYFPTGGLERFEILVDQVIEAVEQVVKPQILLGTTASLEYLVGIGGDAREGILGALTLAGEGEESDKLEVFDRPCQFVGLRLGFPPYQIERATKQQDSGESAEDVAKQFADSGKEEAPKPDDPKERRGADWMATLTLQSLPDEPTRLSVEVNGRWMAPGQWEDVSQVVGMRLKTVDDFLRTKISEFLKHFRSDR